MGAGAWPAELAAGCWRVGCQSLEGREAAGLGQWRWGRGGAESWRALWRFGAGRGGAGGGGAGRGAEGRGGRRRGGARRGGKLRSRELCVFIWGRGGGGGRKKFIFPLLNIRKFPLTPGRRHKGGRHTGGLGVFSQLPLPELPVPHDVKPFPQRPAVTSQPTKGKRQGRMGAQGSWFSANFRKISELLGSILPRPVGWGMRWMWREAAS